MSPYRDDRLSPPPYQSGPTLRDLAGGDNNVVNMILNRGRIEAEGAQRSGDILANTAANVGQVVGQGLAQRAEKKERTKRSAAVDALFAGPEPPTPQAIIKVFGHKEGLDVIKGLHAVNPQTPADQYKDRMERARDAARGIKALPVDKQPGAYTFARNGLVSSGLFKPEEMPEEYNPDVVDQAAAYGQEPAKPQPLIKGSAGDVFLDPVTHQPVASIAPKPPIPAAVGTFEDYVQRKFGPQPTPRQIESAKSSYAAAGRDPKAGTGDAQRERLIEAVVANPSLWDDLTPSDKGNIAGDLSQKGFSGFGKGLPEKAVAQISASKSSVDSLRDLREVLQKNEQYIGPIAGLQALNPYSDARKAQSNIDLVRQRVGKTLEGGVLRKEDEEKYKKILSTLTDEPTTAIYKIDNLIKSIENDMANYIEEQRASGRRVSTTVGSRAGTAPKKNPFRK